MNDDLFPLREHLAAVQNILGDAGDSPDAVAPAVDSLPAPAWLELLAVAVPDLFAADSRPGTPAESQSLVPTAAAPQVSAPFTPDAKPGEAAPPPAAPPPAAFAPTQPQIPALPELTITQFVTVQAAPPEMRGDDRHGADATTARAGSGTTDADDARDAGQADFTPPPELQQSPVVVLTDLPALPAGDANFPAAAAVASALGLADDRGDATTPAAAASTVAVTPPELPALPDFGQALTTAFARPPDPSAGTAPTETAGAAHHSTRDAFPPLPEGNWPASGADAPAGHGDGLAGLLASGLTALPAVGGWAAGDGEQAPALAGLPGAGWEGVGDGSEGGAAGFGEIKDTLLALAEAVKALTEEMKRDRGGRPGPQSDGSFVPSLAGQPRPSPLPPYQPTPQHHSDLTGHFTADPAVMRSTLLQRG